MEHRPLRSNDVRERNEKLALSLLFHNGAMSQSQVVQRTGLKAPTVFRIFAKLEARGFIARCPDESGRETEWTNAVGTERKGRRPNYYCVVPENAYAVGIDFSSSAAAVIVVDFSNSVIFDESTEFIEGSDRDTILGKIATMVRGALEANGLTANDLLGIGIGSPGVVDTERGRILEYTRIVGLAGFSVKAYFEERFGVPVLVHNNASVIAASAYHYGAGRDVQSLLAVLVRSGVGGALITHGELFLNGTTTALEIGRAPVGVGDPEALARDESTLESVVAERPMLRLVQAHHHVQTWSDVERALDVADVNRALFPARQALATEIRALHHVFRPEALLLITRHRIIGDVLGASLQTAVPEMRVIPYVYDPVQACYGAIDLVFKAFFAG